MSLTLLAAHGGYNFREFLWLVASPELAVHLSNGGGPVLLGRTDGGHPELYGLSREESHRLRGSLFYSLFNFQQPVLLLPQNHRELLWLALQNNSDEQISRIVGVSLAAVKKRWSALFERVERCRPGLLPDSAQNGVRGPAKRDGILQYIRQHPEELRPYTPRAGVFVC
jgi:hypothetical protein